MSVVPSNGFNGTVTLGTTALPSNTTASFNPQTITGSGNSTLTITTSANTPPGSQTFTVTGSSNGVNGSQPVGLIVDAGAPTYSVNPSSGSGTSQTFMFTWSDPDGYTDVAYGNGLFNTSLDGRNACWFDYDATNNIVWLARDDGANWDSMPLNGQGTLQNSQCAISAAGASVTGSGSNLTLSLPISFKSPGARNIYMWGQDRNGFSNGYQQAGSWAVPGP